MLAHQCCAWIHRMEGPKLLEYNISCLGGAFNYLYHLQLCLHIFYLRITRKNMLLDNANNRKVISLNLKVPIMIVSSFILLYAIHDILLATKLVQFFPWLNCVYTMNIFIDAIIYIFGTPKLRKIICHWSRTTNEVNQNTDHSIAACVEVSVYNLLWESRV